MKLLVLLTSILVSVSAKAAMVDIGAFYYADTFTKDGMASTYNRTFFDVTVATPLSKSTFIGWHYLSTSSTDNPGTAETLSGTQMGLKLFYFFGRQQMWRLGVSYNLVASSNYSTTSAVWKGTGIQADFGAAIPFSESGSFTLRLNYSSTNYVDQYIGADYLQVTNTRVYIYPSVGTQWMF